MAKFLGLGTCYFPEHWDEGLWREDAQRMRDMGLTLIRMGEFAWSRIEPSPGNFNFDWLDRAIAVLAEEGLQVCLCTPTATPPKWLVDAQPDILAYDKEGRPRGFGSRRHYCFSSESYLREAKRITEIVTERYGRHPAVTAWQTDNEYGCHDTVRSYSPNARTAFQRWLAAKYQTPALLNQAWGNVFWSMEYTSFDQVELPNLTVTEPNPSHVLDFYRFSSDQVIRWNREMVAIIRKNAPGRDIHHNAMGFEETFDHFALGADLDVISWDSYPLGFTDMAPFPDALKAYYRRQGHPDLAAFHHDLYRGCAGGRWWIAEQQPGPVNWAHHNPAPLDGVVRLWTWEAFARGAELVSYFRWRQAPFAQEQMHAGLLRPDSAVSRGGAEATRVGAELQAMEDLPAMHQADVAMIYDYEAAWLFSAQPQGQSWSYREQFFSWYSAARSWGLDIDIISPHHSLAGYKMVLAPSLPILPDYFLGQIEAFDGPVIFGPRSGSKTADLQIPNGLAPGALRRLIDITVTEVESLPCGHMELGKFGRMPVEAQIWLEHIESPLEPLARLESGAGLLYQDARISYFAAVPGTEFLRAWLAHEARSAELHPITMPEGVRMMRRGDMTVLVNYAPEPVELTSALADIAGQARMVPAEVLICR